MENPVSLEESPDKEQKIDIRKGIEICIKHDTSEPIREPFTIVEHPQLVIETVGKVDNTKLWISDKEIDATIYLVDKLVETNNCSRSDAQVQYEHQKLTQNMLTRVLMSQRMDHFLNNAIPIMEEEIRQLGILESILW